ncbi:MAG TPA: helix-turn-helix domain-containing protein [Pseudonocardiaceae bacterium]
MKATRTTIDSPRLERVLTVALEVFGRHGFRKTSMEDVARAADLSRQGLYLHFPNKEALFQAAVRHELDIALDEVSQRLNKDTGELDQRLVSAMDAWLGRYVGSMLASDISTMLESPASQLKDIVEPAIAAFDTQVAAAIAAATTKTDLKRLRVTAEQVAAVLHTAGQGAKYLSRSREEFLARMTAATHLVLAGFDTT